MKTILITGTSSGIGRAIVNYFAAKGWNVAATMRSPEKETEMGKIPHVKLFRFGVLDEAGTPIHCRYHPNLRPAGCHRQQCRVWGRGGL